MNHWHPDIIAMVFLSALVIGLVLVDCPKRRKKLR